MFMLMPPLWPAIGPMLIAAAAALFIPLTPVGTPATLGYLAITGGSGGALTGLLTAAAIIAAAFLKKNERESEGEPYKRSMKFVNKGVKKDVYPDASVVACYSSFTVCSSCNIPVYYI